MPNAYRILIPLVLSVILWTLIYQFGMTIINHIWRVS